MNDDWLIIIWCQLTLHFYSIGKCFPSIYLYYDKLQFLANQQFTYLHPWDIINKSILISLVVL